ncbi:MAG: response regulator [Magnetococcales bacterium]|nr:response regulator [Magnetococcales bacterium]
MNALFLQPGEDPGTALAGFYEPHLVLLSLLAAYLGSFAGLSVIRPLAGEACAWSRRIWLAFGTFALGCGIFIMHFLGMLAFRLPVSVAYDVVTTLVSSLPGFLSAWWLLRLASRKDRDARSHWLGGVVVGAGIGAMHFTGMMAMRLEAVMRFDPVWFWGSILLAMLLAMAAIRARAVIAWLRWDPDGGIGRHAAPILMSMAIAGMHYTAMSATIFLPGLCEAEGKGWRIDPLVMGLGLAIVMFTLIVSFLFAVYLGHRERGVPGSPVLTLRMRAREHRVIFLKSLASVLGVFLLFAWIAVFVHEFTEQFLNKHDRTEEMNRVVLGLEDDFRDIQYDLRTIVEGVNLLDFLDKGSHNHLMRLTGQLLLMARERRMYDRIRLVDTRGEERVAVVADADGTASVVPTSALRSGLEVDPGAKGIRVSRLEWEGEWAVLRFAAPVFDSRGDWRGSVILDYRASEMLETLQGLARRLHTAIDLIDEDGRFLLKRFADFGARSSAIWAFVGQRPAGEFQTAHRQFLFRRLTVAGQGERPSWTILFQIGESRWNWGYLLDRPITSMLLLGGLLMSLAIAWIVALFLVARRVSEQAETEARRELLFQKRALDEHAIVSTTDARGIIIYVNDNFVAISGYTREELLGSNHRLVKSDEHGPEFYRQMWRTIVSGRSWHGEVKNQARDGSYYWVRATIVPMLDEQGKPFQYVSIRTDITAMKELESSLRVAKEQAVAAARAKSDFLANMSHEIRTPMNAIIGLSHLCLQTQLSARQKDYLRKVHNSATSLLRIINDILDFSKIEAGRLAMETIDFTLEEVLGNLASMISLKAQEKQLEFLMETAPNIPPVLRGDPLRLGQILVNLANNAIKFTEQGEVAVVTELLDKDESLLCLQFTVRDTGIGMTEAQCKGLFRAFSQADTSITRKYGGTGLGLTIAKRLIEMMAGSIRVESEPGVGTRFIFNVCMGYVPQEVEKSLLPAVDLRGLKALVVDDNESARNVIADYLASFTFKVSKANGAAEAIIAVQEAEMVGTPFDLVVMDYMMPLMDGITVTAKMRHDLGLTRQPVVIMATAYGEEHVVRRAVEEAEVNGFLVKPISQNLLFEAVMEAFGRFAGSSRESGASLVGERDFMAVLSGARILLVEDNEINQQVARELLEQANITVLLAVNGQEAVVMVEQETLDGVLMDMQMPVMDGLTATRRIRQDSRFAGLPIIAMTANAMAGDRDLCLEAGMQDHIAKPVEPRAMFATMARWIKPASPAPFPASATDKPMPEAGDTLPDLPGLDARDGLRRMGGNVRGYLNLLAKFRVNQGEAEGAIRRALAEGDMATAERMVHTLKGVGASIGARELSDRAHVLEQAIRAGEDGARLEPLLTAAGRSLAELCAMLDEMLVPPQPEQAPGVVEETGELLVRRRELLRLAGEQLQIYDASIEKTLAQLRTTFAANQAPEWLREMEQLVGRYDFEAAVHILRSQEEVHHA